MDSNTFFTKLSRVANSFHWTVDKHNKIVAKVKSGPDKGTVLNPVTAIAYKAGYPVYNSSRDETEWAASVLGLSRDFARSVHSATLATYNTGNTQVLRGKIRSALGV